MSYAEFITVNGITRTMNTLFVLLDGAEDDPVPEFGGKKPLDVAKMPFMASKAPHRAYTIGRGYTHLFLNEFFTGHPPEIARAALEGLGLGMDVGKRTAYRLSPAILRDGMINWSYHAEEFCDRLIPKVEEHLSFVKQYDPEIKFFLNGRASLPAKPIYKKRGYRETEYHTVQTENGDFLCYDVMEMKQSEANPCKVGVQGSQG